MNSAIDSEATFTARALELGMEKGFLDLLIKANVKSLGALAFVSPYQIGQADEKPLIDAVRDLIRRDVTTRELIPLRRLWFEASTTVMGELKQKVERLVFQQGADQQLSWIPWERLTSRAHEVTHSRSDLGLQFDAAGNLRLTKKMQESSCTLSGELQIRQALQRRALAYDLARLCDFSAMELYHEELFFLLTRSPPQGCLYVTMAQVRESDKQLFVRLAEKTRGALTARPDGSKPLQVQLEALKSHPQVQFCLIPAPKSARFQPYEPPEGRSDRAAGGKKGQPPKGKGAQTSGGGGKGPSTPFELPPGCSSQHEGKPVCFGFNCKGCKFAKPGKRCRRGLHVCWKCFAPHSYTACPLAN